MKEQYHILNGDALKQQFPKEIEGSIIIARECLVDGDVKSSSLDQLFQSRAHFIATSYEGFTVEDYYSSSVSEFEKVKQIPEDSDINLWFEDDLFCQVNLWFTTYLLSSFVKNCHVFLVRPQPHAKYCFNKLTEQELVESLKKRTQLAEMKQIAILWEAYQHNNYELLTKTASSLSNNFSFINEAVKAHLERIPSEGKLGRPIHSLLEIINELKTDEFIPVFNEFKRREAIYGFGDMQVRRLLQTIKDRNLVIGE